MDTPKSKKQSSSLSWPWSVYDLVFLASACEDGWPDLHSSFYL